MTAKVSIYVSCKVAARQLIEDLIGGTYNFYDIGTSITVTSVAPDYTIKIISYNDGNLNFTSQPVTTDIKNTTKDPNGGKAKNKDNSDLDTTILIIICIIVLLILCAMIYLVYFVHIRNPRRKEEDDEEEGVETSEQKRERRDDDIRRTSIKALAGQSTRGTENIALKGDDDQGDLELEIENQREGHRLSKSQSHARERGIYSSVPSSPDGIKSTNQTALPQKKLKFDSDDTNGLLV